MKNQIIFVLAFIFLIQTAVSQTKNTMIVASYNIRYENPHDGIHSWNNRKEQVKSLIQFHDFDIFGTQEAVYNQVLDIAKLEQYAHYGKGRDDGKQAGEHCAIFYKKELFNLLDSGDFWLSETPDKPSLGWDAPNCKRICSWVKLIDKRSNKEFYFFSVHFDHQGKEARRESGKLMVSKIKEITNGKPVICVGDFNSTPDSEQILYIQTFLKDAFQVSEQPPYGPCGTSNGFRYDVVPINRIDYIFISKQIDVFKYGVLTDSYELRFPSDHLPVVTEIIIR